jgi:hypothetical protein
MTPMTTTSILLLTSLVTCVDSHLLAAPSYSLLLLLIGLHAPANTPSPDSSSRFVLQTTKATTIPSRKRKTATTPMLCAASEE